MHSISIQAQAASTKQHCSNTALRFLEAFLLALLFASLAKPSFAQERPFIADGYFPFRGLEAAAFYLVDDAGFVSIHKVFCGSMRGNSVVVFRIEDGTARKIIDDESEVVLLLNSKPERNYSGQDFASDFAEGLCATSSNEN